MGKRKSIREIVPDEEIDESPLHDPVIRSKIKTLLDEARKGKRGVPKICSTARGYIDELDNEYDGGEQEEPKRGRRKKETGLLESIVKFFTG